MRSRRSLTGAVPAGWTLSSLGAVAEQGGGGIQTGPFGSQLHASDYVSEGIPSIMPQNIGDNRLVPDGIARIGERDAQRLSRYRVQAGDIVYSRRGDVEKRALIRKPEDGWLCGTGCLRVRLGGAGPDPAFVSYYLGDPRVRRWVVDHAVGATMPNLNTAILSELPLLLPSRREQRAIAGVLGALDDKIELNRRMNETLDQLAREMFSHRFLNSRSNSWPKTPISDLCSTQYGYTASATLDPVGPRFLRVMDINKRPWIDWATVPHCEIDDDKLSKYKLERGDIVVARMADPGKSAIVEDDVDAVFASYLVRLKTKSLQLAYFLHGYLHSSLYREYAEGAIGGSVQRNMNARVITGTDVRLPPEAELKAHFADIEPVRARLSHNVRESRTLAELRDALLPKLISGELRVRDGREPSQSEL